MVIFYWTTIAALVLLTASVVFSAYRVDRQYELRLTNIEHYLEVIISDQEHLNADVAALVAAAAAISDQIAALKAQPAAEALDFTGLDNVVATFQGLVPPAAAPADSAPAE